MKRFTAKYLYTLTSREPLRNAFVEVSDNGTVLSVGNCAPGEAIDYEVLVPGFVNAHCHV